MRKTALLIIVTAILLVSAGGRSYVVQASEISPKQISPIAPKLPKQILQIRSLVLDKTSVVAGSASSDIVGTVTLNLAPPTNIRATVKLSTAPFNSEAGILTMPEVNEITIPQGSAQATFRIKTFLNSSYGSPTSCTATAMLGDSKATASFTVEQLRMVSMIVLPAVGVGPYSSTGTLTMSAVPAAGTTVVLTSSDPNVAGFGPIGSAQSTGTLSFTFGGISAVKTIPVAARAVSQTISVTITATFRNQRAAQLITVRSAP